MSDESTELLIQAIHLSRRAAKSGRLLLDQVNLSLAAGERIGLVGNSGSEKSTLLRAVCRLDACDSGKILFRGESVSAVNVPGYRRRVVYLPQRSSFVAGTLRENLQVPFRWAWIASLAN